MEILKRFSAFAITLIFLVSCGGAPAGGGSSGALDTTPKVEAPVFTPPGGEYYISQKVDIACPTEGATILYTTDLSSSAPSYLEYTHSLTFDKTTKIKVITSKAGMKDNSATATFTILSPSGQTAAPVLKPPPGTYSNSQQIVITSPTAGATIYYTTDGSTPTTDSARYSAPINLGYADTIKAIAVKYSMYDSYVTSGSYSFTPPVAGQNVSLGVGQGAAMEMIWVAPGTFNMGETTTDDFYNINNPAFPEHKVNIANGFWLGKYEVTQAQWKAVMNGLNPSWYDVDNYCPDADDRPVEMVSYNDAVQFVAVMNAANPGLHFRLPTEAEWEYAAGGGNNTHNYIYSGSNTIDSVGWYSGKSGTNQQTHAVGGLSSNELGFHDMSGNVAEWVDDYYGDYSIIESVDPKGPATGTYRVARGGDWSLGEKYSRTSRRESKWATSSDSMTGFRLALSVQESILPPTFSPQAGSYASERTVVLSSPTSGTTIYYTTDGSDPTLSSKVYSSSFKISKSATVKAFAFKPGIAASSVSSAPYSFPDAVLVAGQNASVTIAPGTALDLVWVAPNNGYMGNIYVYSGVWIGKYEVTQAQWKALSNGDNPSKFKSPDSPNGDVRPVDSVSWDDCQAFLDRLNVATGKNFVLPWGYERSFAADGGAKSAGYVYSGSSTADSVAWYGNKPGTNDESHPVGSLAPNELGIYDMSGNVWEWVADEGAAMYYNHKALYGGGFNSGTYQLYPDAVTSESADGRYSRHGFRVLLRP